MATLSDIAKKAGCSVNLVAYVLKKGDSVTKEKHKEILRIAKELNYRPNFAARALVTGKTDNIMFIVDSFKGQMETAFFPELISEFAKELEKVGMGLQLKEINNLSAEEMKNCLLSGQSDGYVWYSCQPPTKEVVDIIHSRNIPSISLGRSKCMPYITIDDYKSTYNMMAYLYDCGHRSFAYCGEIAPTPRKMAYDDFLKSRGLQTKVNIPFRERQYGHINTIKHTLENNGVNFTAVVCERDSFAIELITLLKYFNVRIPEDVSIVGYDDIPDARICVPALTTIHQSCSEMAEEAVLKLRQMINGTSLDDIINHMVVHEVVRRDSVKILR